MMVEEPARPRGFTVAAPSGPHFQSDEFRMFMYKVQGVTQLCLLAYMLYDAAMLRARSNYSTPRKQA